MVFQNNILVENGIGIAPLIMGPSSGSHQYADDYVEIKNNIFIGKTASFDEALDVKHNDFNMGSSTSARYVSSSKPCGKIGFLMTTFTTAGNNLPTHPFLGIMGYQAIRGTTLVNGKYRFLCVTSFLTYKVVLSEWLYRLFLISLWAFHIFYKVPMILDTWMGLYIK